MNTLIFGPGALGCTLARHLRSDAPVSLFGPRPPRGEEFTSLWRPQPPAKLQAPSLLWLTCKASQLESLVQEVLAPLLRQSTPEVLERSLLVAPQNGLGVTALIEGARLPIPFCRVVAWFGARWENSQLIESPPPRRLTLSSEAGPLSQALETQLSRAGFSLDRTEGPKSNTIIEWKKALTSVALNPVVALAGVTNGALLASSELQSRARLLQDEAFLVFEALGLGGITRQAAWSDLQRTCLETASNRNSMLQDLEAGRPLELPWLNEWLLIQASRAEIELPAHREIAREIRLAEQRFDRQKRDAR